MIRHLGRKRRYSWWQGIKTQWYPQPFLGSKGTKAYKVGGWPVTVVHSRFQATSIEYAQGQIAKLLISCIIIYTKILHTSLSSKTKFRHVKEKKASFFHLDLAETSVKKATGNEFESNTLNQDSKTGFAFKQYNIDGRLLWRTYFSILFNLHNGSSVLLLNCIPGSDTQLWHQGRKWVDSENDEFIQTWFNHIQGDVPNIFHISMSSNIFISQVNWKTRSL